MSKPRGLDAIAGIAKRAEAEPRQAGNHPDPIRDPLDCQRAAPTHLWSPEDCGDLDIRISRSGLWHYLKTPIGREPMVQLFASVLTKEANGKHYLVTPVEKIGIQVDDVAFIALDFDIEPHTDGELLFLVTNVGDRVALRGTRHLRVEFDPETAEPTPYAPIRGALEARIDRKTFYRLAQRSVFRDNDKGERCFGFWSGGVFFPLAHGEAARELEQLS
jgi:hypothetical protein